MNKKKGMTNFTTRMIINSLGIPAILLLIRAGGISFAVFVGLVAVLGQIEFYNLMRMKGLQPWVIGGIGTGIAWIIISYLLPKFPHPLLILIFLLYLAIVLFKNIENTTANTAVTFLGFLYLPFMLSVLIVLREIPRQFDGHYPDGSKLVMLIFAAIWICDSLAYVFGKWLGKKKIAPTISPGKTWVGCVAGFFGAIVTVIIFYYLGWKPEFIDFSDMLVIGAIAGIFGQAGDFIESAFKRDASIKDSSSLLMGHGGVLDRFDSFLFAPGFVYLYLLFFM